jgi:16S rRNA (adenine1518-N6/adenine1519-N6)-dimethyltransferase
VNEPRDRSARAALPPVRKSLGQHFLNDRRILQRIVDAIDIVAGDTVVEVGPGRGSLTALLAERASRLIVIEYDRALAGLLRDRYSATSNVSVVEADVLSVSLGDVAGSPFKLVGNVPYYITTPILFHALEPPRPTRAVYLVQREVAERIVARPGTKEYGALSVNVQAVAQPTQLFRVPAGAFQPPPKVESAVIRIDPRSDPVIAPDEEDPFRRLVQDAFGMRRKQLRRVLRSIAALSAEDAEAALSASGIDPTARPEVLSPADFARLLRALGR